MQDILLSVIVPFYNAKDTIPRTVESVLGQPRADCIELLLMDDGSRDEGGAVCDRYAESHAGPGLVRVIHKENGGASSAMNLGIQKARGRYICFLDADDWWVSGFFDEGLVKLLEEDYDLYTFSYQSVSPDLRWRKVYPLEECARRDLKPDCDRPFYIRHWACIHSRAHLLRHGLRYPLCNVNEDVPFVHLASSLAGSIRSSSRVMVSYWLNPKSCVHTSSPKKTMDEILRSLRIEEEMFRERGFDYSNDREILSEITRKLPPLCAQMRYRELQTYLAQPEFDLLRQETIKPWQSLRGQLDAFRKHPRRFWLRSRVSPGLSMAVKRLSYSSPALMRLACFLRYRLLLGWERLP